MATRIRRRFRPPVLSRLTWAWLIFALAAIAFSFYLVTAGRRAESPTRVALALGAEVENMARPLPQPLRTALPAPGAAIAADEIHSPTLRDGEPRNEPYSSEG